MCHLGAFSPAARSVKRNASADGSGGGWRCWGEEPWERQWWRQSRGHGKLPPWWPCRWRRKPSPPGCALGDLSRHKDVNSGIKRRIKALKFFFFRVVVPYILNIGIAKTHTLRIKEVLLLICVWYMLSIGTAETDIQNKSSWTVESCQRVKQQSHNYWLGRHQLAYHWAIQETLTLDLVHLLEAFTEIKEINLRNRKLFWNYRSSFKDSPRA